MVGGVKWVGLSGTRSQVSGKCLRYYVYIEKVVRDGM